MTRLTDEELEYVENACSLADTDDMIRLTEYTLHAIAELRTRRLQDLTDEDKSAVHFLRGELQLLIREGRANGTPRGWHNHAYAALAVLDRLLKEHS